MDSQLLSTPTKTQRTVLPIYNLSCAGGGALTVERALLQTPGVRHAYVNPATEMAYVEYEEGQTDAASLTATLEQIGFGAPRIETPRRSLPPTVVMARLDSRRWALAGGLWLTAIYTLCIIADLLFPQVFHMRVLWEILFVGFDWTQPWTLLLGLVEAFLYGAFGAWSLTVIFNTLNNRQEVTQ
jgi:cation transport ATPase